MIIILMIIIMSKASTRGAESHYDLLVNHKHSAAILFKNLFWFLLLPDLQPLAFQLSKTAAANRVSTGWLHRLPGDGSPESHRDSSEEM